MVVCQLCENEVEPARAAACAFCDYQFCVGCIESHEDECAESDNTDGDVVIEDDIDNLELEGGDEDGGDASGSDEELGDPGRP